MTYAQFHLVFVLPVIALLLLILKGLSRKLQIPFFPRKLKKGIFLIVLLALAYTTPWDNYLVYKQVWSYPEDRVLASIGYVPIEEYSFFILMSVLTGLWTYILYLTNPVPKALPRKNSPRVFGTLFFLILSGIGFYLLQWDQSLYLGLILAWASPVFAIHWAFGGDWILNNFRIWSFGVLLPSVYLGATDKFAIQSGIWSISPKFTTQIFIFGLPVEEALFFTVANILVVQGLLTYWISFDQRQALKLPAWANKFF